MTDRAEDPAAVIVRHVTRRMKGWGRAVLPEVNVREAVTDIVVADTMEGAATLTMHLLDKDFELLDSGFFDANRDGRLDRIEVNFPEGSEYWWRLTQIEVDRQERQQVQMVFMARAAVSLMELRGPLKANRAKATRAEFLKSLTDKVRVGGGLDFHSRELHERQPLEKDKQLSDRKRKKAKSQGIHDGERLLIGGGPMERNQIRNAERILDEAARLKAPKVAVLALLYAAIGESRMGADLGTNAQGYGSILGANAQVWAGHFLDFELMTHEFMLGGRGFHIGAIKLANQGVTNPREIAIRVEVPSIWPDDSYAHQQGGHRFLEEAEAILEAYGGPSFGAATYRKQYNFQVGSHEDPHEDFWTASKRLAAEVNWAYFVDGRDVYYDAETILVQQKPAAVLAREDQAVVTWSYTWDARHICTEMTLVLVCEPLEFRAGEVMRLNGFGAASTGSTARLPGRWLIASSERSVYSPTTTFTLRQPEKPKREPLGELAERKEPAASTADLRREMTPKEVIDQIVLPIAAECGITLTPAEVEQRNAVHGPTVTGGRSDHQGPPNVAWAADMSNGYLTAQEDRLAKRLAEVFGIKPINLRVANEAGNIHNATHDGFRFQLIYRWPGHQNHVHFGARVA